jgi:hypothetical protein
MYKHPLERFELHKSETVLMIHNKLDCDPNRPCPFHNPTDHHMRDWPMLWRSDRFLLERICPCGVGHPDYDDKSENKIHGCCGCCRSKSLNVQ